MAAASYTTDLTTWQDFEATNGSVNIVEFNGYTVTNQNREEAQDPDNPLQGSQHASIEQRNTGQGSLATNTGGSVTLTSPEAFFIWCNFLQSVAVNTFQNDGLVGFLGSGTGNYYRWTIGGSNFGRAPYGGYFNVALDPTISTNGRTLNGSAPTSISVVGFGADVISQINRGSPYNMDVIRHGRGEVIVTDGDLANGYATFSGIAAVNDDNNNRWGLFQEQFGSYLWKGLLNLGSTTSVDFRDANEVIFIDNTLHVASNFNRIEVRGTSSNIVWDNINISALGITGPTNGTTASRGQFEMIDAAAVTMNTCVFTDMDTWIFNGGNLTNTTWRRCRAVTQAGATFTGCTFDETDSGATESLIANNLSLVTDCAFNRSSGTVNAVFVDNITADATLTWDNNTLTGYGSQSAGNGISSTAGGAIRLRFTSGTPTITIAVTGADATIPTVEIVNDGGTGTVNITAAVSLSINGLLGNSEVRIYDNPSTLTGAGTATEVGGVETVAAVTVTGNGTNNYINYNTGGSNVVVSVALGNFTATELQNGDTFRVLVRDNVDNPTLQLFDEFTVSGTPTTTSITTTTLSSGFTSVFGSVINGVNSKTVTVEKQNATETFSLSAGTYDIAIFRTASLPVYFLEQSVNADGSIPVTQVLDRVYNNPA